MAAMLATSICDVRRGLRDRRAEQGGVERSLAQASRDPKDADDFAHGAALGGPFSPRRRVVKGLGPLAQELVGTEGGLVAERGAALDAIAEVHVRPGGARARPR